MSKLPQNIFNNFEANSGLMQAFVTSHDKALEYSSMIDAIFGDEDKHDLYNDYSSSAPSIKDFVLSKIPNSVTLPFQEDHDHDHDHDEADGHEGHNHDTGEFELDGAHVTTSQDSINDISDTLSTMVGNLYQTYTSGTGLMGLYSDYNITLEFMDVTQWSEYSQNLMFQAAEYLSQVIIGDVPDVGSIDDIKIEVHVADIDGSVAGQGGWIARRGDGMPYEGGIRIDTAYVEYSSLHILGTHELLHAMGHGTVFTYMDLFTTDPDGVKRFTGENAIQAYNEGEYANVAENDPYSHLGIRMDSSGAHWRNTDFGTGEIQTTNFRPGTFNFSSVTLGSLEDMGYQTIYDTTDPAGSVLSWDAFLGMISEGPNGLPVAVDDNFIINEDTVLNGNVLTNDSDPDGHSITALADTLVSQFGGAVTINSDGTFEYTPALDFSGTDTFNYYVVDELGARSQGTVTITVNDVIDNPNNLAPVAGDDAFTLDEDTTVSGNVLSNDNDPDGDSLSVVAETLNTVGGQVTINSDGSFTYRPNKDYNGTDSFEYTVTDGKDFNATDIGTVNLTINPVDEPTKGNKGKGGKKGGDGGGTDDDGGSTGGGGYGKGGKKKSAGAEEEQAANASLIEESADVININDVLSSADHIEDIFANIGNEIDEVFGSVVSNSVAEAVLSGGNEIEPLQPVAEDIII